MILWCGYNTDNNILRQSQYRTSLLDLLYTERVQQRGVERGRGGGRKGERGGEREGESKNGQKRKVSTTLIGRQHVTGDVLDFAKIFLQMFCCCYMRFFFHSVFKWTFVWWLDSDMNDTAICKCKYYAFSVMFFNHLLFNKCYFLDCTLYIQRLIFQLTTTFLNIKTDEQILPV